VNYFVTGATGFIGRHLLEELLKRDGTVHALVREGSRGRLEEIAERLGAGDRVVPVVGDLSKERLGIEGFGERIDHFFHLAAIYDMAADEEEMERANVDGTRHVVEFANSIDVGMFHHTSSIAVAGRFKGLFREDMFDEDQELPHAYHRSKFESERVARTELKAPLRVYRPGIVVGHSETGEMDKIDGPYYFFKLIQKLRYALPQWFPLAGPEGKNVNLVPVDFVARAMDHIAHMDDSDLYGNTFHLVDPEPLTVGQSMNEFARAAHAPEFAMRIDSSITNAIPKPVKAGLRGFPPIARARRTMLGDLGIPESALQNRDFRCDFDARDAQRALSGTGIAVPPLSSYAPKLWDYWERNLDPDLHRERSLAKTIDGKRILITGASSGIGREVALKVGEAGGTVMLVARTREKLESVAREVEERGGTAHVHPADLSDTTDIERMANEVVEQHGGIDILVNNAGRSIRRSVKYQYDRLHDFERTMQLNYFGALRLILTFLPGMRERRSGHIINISSYSVQMNTPRFSAYAASKAALDQFSRCLAAEVVDKSINITTVYMPLVRTPMIAPTDFYKTLPALEPEEAGQLVCDAMIDKPKRVAKRLGTTAQVLYTLNPKVTDQIAHMVYRLFPEKDPKKKEEERRALEDGGEPAKGDGQGEEISSEATALAYLMRGVYF
jgi:NAD(P)-dependent dehydrogenase (short-subunit alcohol dehydrogenase family)